MKRPPVFPLALLCCLLLASCGTDSEAPAPTPSPTIVPTLPPDAVTVGSLLDRMDAAWSGVSSMRTTFWTTTAAEAGTPPAGGPLTIEEIVLPANRHVVQMVGGTVVDGRIYMKGALVPAAIAPMMDVNTWVEIDPAAATSDSPIAQQVAYLTSPLTSPIGSVSPETRGLQAIPGAEVTFGERRCATYTFGAGSIAYELAIDANDLPCRLVLTASGMANVTLFEFNIPGLVLTAPELSTPPAP